MVRGLLARRLLIIISHESMCVTIDSYWGASQETPSQEAPNRAPRDTTCSA